MGILDGKVAVVTGSTRGLGLAIAQAYAREGASVVVSSRSEEAITRAVELIGKQAAGVVVDVSDLAQVRLLAAYACDTFGKIDIW